MRFWNLRGLQQHGKERMPRQRAAVRTKYRCNTCADTKRIYEDEYLPRRTVPCPDCVPVSSHVRGEK